MVVSTSKMQLSPLWVVVVFSTLLQASLSIPITSSKPKPVNLAYSCVVVADDYRKDLKPDDVPVILIHGMTLSKESWNGIFESLAFATHKKVCAVDLRNHGRSPWNDEEYDVVAMTEDIRHFMDTLMASKAIVVGHSLGGKVAVHLSVNYPELVEKVIVEDMRPNGIGDDAIEGAKSYARFLLDLEKRIPQGVSEKEAKEKINQIMKDYFAKINVTYPLEEMSIIKCSNGKCQLTINPALLEAILRNFTELNNESSGCFNGPALFIYGSESPNKVGEDESNIKKMFPNAELVSVEGADHNVHSSRQFLTEVVKFIKK